MIACLSLLLALTGLSGLLMPPALAARRPSVPGGALTDSATRPAALARLAAQTAEVYRDSNQAVLLDNLFRLHLLSRRYADAAAALADWRRAWATRGDTTARARAVNGQYEIYLRAKRLQGDRAGAFPAAFARAFRERFARLDDRAAALVARTLSVPPLPAAHPRRARAPRLEERAAHESPLRGGEPNRAGAGRAPESGPADQLRDGRGRERGDGRGRGRAARHPVV